MWSHLGIDLLAHVIFFCFLLGLGYVIYLTSRRKGLKRFFGLRGSRIVNVFVSHLFIKSGGAIGAGGVARSYSGSAVPYGELSFADRFRNVFNVFIPKLADLPGFLKRILLSDIIVNTHLSPHPSVQLDRSLTTVTTGSPGYNSVSEWVQSNLNPFASFDPNNSSISVPSGGPHINGRVCFVQRLKDTATKNTVFYAAGLSEAGTMGAIHYLQKYWSDLYKTYESDIEFCVLLEVDSSDLTVSRIIDSWKRP